MPVINIKYMQSKEIEHTLVNDMKTYIDISPSKNKKVCQNCNHFEKFGVHLGVCLNRKKYTEKLDTQTCNKFDFKTT